MNDHIGVGPIAGARGAEIHGVDLPQALDDETFGEFKPAFLDRRAIFFRDQNLTENRHKALGRRFGMLNIHPRHAPAAPPVGGDTLFASQYDAEKPECEHPVAITHPKTGRKRHIYRVTVNGGGPV